MRTWLRVVAHCELLEGGLEVQLGASKRLSVLKRTGLMGPDA